MRSVGHGSIDANAVSGLSATEGVIRRVDRAAIVATLSYSNAIIPLIALVLCASTLLLLDLANSWPVLLLCAFGAHVVYNLERSVFVAPEDHHNHPARVEWTIRHRSFVFGSLAVAFTGVLVSLSLIYAQRPSSFFVTISCTSLLAILAVGYLAPRIPGLGRLKGLWYLKPIWIALAWTTGTVLLPAVVAGQPLSTTVLALAAYRFAYLLPNILLSDYPDAKGDTMCDLQTPATVLGPKRFHRLLRLTVVLAFLIAASVAVMLGRPELLLLDLPATLVVALLARRTTATGGPGRRLAIDAALLWPIALVLYTVLQG